MAFTGCRISGVPYLASTERMGWLEVPDVQKDAGGGADLAVHPLINHLPGLDRFPLEHRLAELSIGGRHLRDAVA